MKIITNPPFRLNRKKFTALLSQADDYVVLHTFKFCNNELGRFELIEYKEWPEVTNALISIAASTMKNNRIERPAFYKSELKDDIFDGCKDYVIFHNSHFMDGEYNKAVGANRPNLAKKLIFEDITPDVFINKHSSRFKEKGAKIKRLVYPRSFINVFEKHLDEIYMDTRMFGNIMLRYPLIRKEFIDENNNESAL